MEIFQDRDPEGTEKISYEHFRDIYRIYEVEFDEGTALSLCDRNGMVSRENFFDYAIKTNLVDLSPQMVFSDKAERRVQETPRKVGVSMQPRPQRTAPRRRKKVCCCGRRPISPEDEDRIEHAFRKMDPNDTGFVTWKQFKKGAHFVDENEAMRIFKGVDRDNDDKITLEDLRQQANKYVHIETGVP